MKIKLINIGNSKGLRLPKSIIQQYKIGEDLQIELQEDGILLKPLTKPRSGWLEKFQNEVKPIDQQEKKWMDARNRFDKEEWTW